MKIYKPQEKFRLPDRTLLANIFSNNDVSNDFLDKLSLFLGEIPPGEKSEIHLHPFVTQVTFVLRSNINILMKSSGELEPTTLKLSPHESVVTPVNTFFQLANESQDETCEVLYIVNPAFLFLLVKLDLQDAS